MKKNWKSKGTIIGLAAACILIAGTCLVVKMKKDGGSFDPGKPPDETVSEWEEAGRPDEREAESRAVWQERENGKHPQMEPDSRDEVVIEFTTEPARPETPEAPVPQGELTDPSAPPSYEKEAETVPEEKLPEESLPEETGRMPEEQTPAEQKPEVPESEIPEPESPKPETPSPSESTPQMDGVREDGAVYDPVFGWVIPSEIIQIEGHSDGDPNKMVGHMD